MLESTRLPGTSAAARAAARVRPLGTSAASTAARHVRSRLRWWARHADMPRRTNHGISGSGRRCLGMRPQHSDGGPATSPCSSEARLRPSPSHGTSPVPTAFSHGSCSNAIAWRLGNSNRMTNKLSEKFLWEHH